MATNWSEGPALLVVQKPPGYLGANARETVARAAARYWTAAAALFTSKVASVTLITTKAGNGGNACRGGQLTGRSLFNPPMSRSVEGTASLASAEESSAHIALSISPGLNTASVPIKHSGQNCLSLLAANVGMITDESCKYVQ